MKTFNPDITISTANLLGMCSVCGEITTGQYDIEQHEHNMQGDDTADTRIRMECVNCHHGSKCNVTFTTYVSNEEEE